VILQKIEMNLFFFRLISEIFPNIKLFEGFYKKKFENSIVNSFLFTIRKTLFISELEKHYSFFKILPDLKINIITNSMSLFELIFLLNSYKFPLKI